MKKFLLLALMIGVFITANAQRATVMPLTAGDTIVNTGTSSKVFTATAGYSGVVVQVNLTKISGTGAGTTKLMGSLDGVNYTAIGTSYTITDVATQAAYFTLANPLPVYIKVTSTGSGTESMKQQVLYVLRKFNN